MEEDRRPIRSTLTKIAFVSWKRQPASRSMINNKDENDLKLSSSTFPPRQVEVETTRQTKTSFDSVEICFYERVLGDNPSCSSGPSVSIGLDYDDNLTVSMSIEEYERKKPHRLVDLEMILSRREREEMLMELG
eukprot:scaffold60173_cov49-Attheya_sp.AAC.2